VKDLAAALHGEDSALVLCDVEGYEQVLLDPVKIHELTRSHILVEVHDFLVPGVSWTLRSRFSKSHGIVEIHPTDRTTRDFPYNTLYLKHLPRIYRNWAVAEGRVEQTHWLWMVPNS